MLYIRQQKRAGIRQSITFVMGSIYLRLILHITCRYCFFSTLLFNYFYRPISRITIITQRTRHDRVLYFTKIILFFQSYVILSVTIMTFESTYVPKLPFAVACESVFIRTF